MVFSHVTCITFIYRHAAEAGQSMWSAGRQAILAIFTEAQLSFLVFAPQPPVPCCAAGRREIAAQDQGGKACITRVTFFLGPHAAGARLDGGLLRL